MKLKDADAWPLAFQAVVKVKLNESVPVHFEYVTHHVTP